MLRLAGNGDAAAALFSQDRATSQKIVPGAGLSCAPDDRWYEQL